MGGKWWTGEGSVCLYEAGELTTFMEIMLTCWPGSWAGRVGLAPHAPGESWRQKPKRKAGVFVTGAGMGQCALVPALGCGFLCFLRGRTT